MKRIGHLERRRQHSCMLLLFLWRQLSAIAPFPLPSLIADNICFFSSAIRQYTIYQILNRASKHWRYCQVFNSHWPRPLSRESIEQRTIGSFVSWSNVAVAFTICFVILLNTFVDHHVYQEHHARHARVISCFFMPANSAMKLYACIRGCFHGMHFYRCRNQGCARACNFVGFLLHVFSLGQQKHCQESGWSSISLHFLLDVFSMQRYHDWPRVIPTICH